MRKRQAIAGAQSIMHRGQLQGKSVYDRLRRRSTKGTATTEA